VRGREMLESETGTEDSSTGTEGSTASEDSDSDSAPQPPTSICLPGACSAASTNVATAQGLLATAQVCGDEALP
jgi:hypothetical protein